MKSLFLSLVLTLSALGANVEFIYNKSSDQVQIKGNGHNRACTYRVKVGSEWVSNMKTYPVNSNGSFSHTLAQGLVPSKNTLVEVRTYEGCDGSYKLDSFVRNASNSRVVGGSPLYNDGKVWVSYNNQNLLVVEGENLKGASYLKFRIIDQGIFFDDYGWYKSRSGRETWEIKNGKFNFTLNREVSELASYSGYIIEARTYDVYGNLLNRYRVSGRRLDLGLRLILDLY